VRNVGVETTLLWGKSIVERYILKFEAMGGTGKLREQPKITINSSSKFPVFGSSNLVGQD
jgi:hypothetical protein